MKKLLLALPLLALSFHAYADLISDLQQSYEAAKQTLGTVLNRPEDTKPTREPVQEDTITALFKRLGGSTSSESTLESNYDAVKKSDATAIAAASEAIRTQDPAKRREAESLLKQADEKRAAFQSQFEAKLKEMVDTLARDHSTIQGLREQLASRQEHGVLDWLFPNTK